MKKILNKHIYFSLMFCFTAICILFASCKSEEIGSPVISSVRMYKPSPYDTLMSVGNPKTDPSLSGGTGSYVAIIGQNLQNALSIKFDGVAATFNSALFAPNSAVVPTPSIIFSTIDTTKLYTIEYVTTTGSTTFSFKLGPAAPKITAISNVFASPGDSVYIYGSNLFLIQSFSYGGTKITSPKFSYDGFAIGFKMPNPAPTSGDVTITTKSGTATFKIVALPTITGISNDNANPGDSVYVYGTYLKSVQSFTFSGATISSFVSATDGSSVGFIMPTITTSGPASIKTPFGTTTTAYNVYNIYNVQFVGAKTTGVLANLEWGDAFGWSWWGGVKYTTGNTAWGGTTDFNGVLGSSTNSQFAYFNSGIMNSGDGTSSWPGTYTFPIGAAQWIPTANLSDPVDNWAIQFELSVAYPWNGSTLCFESGFAGNYVARYEPWQISASSTKAFSTKGWQTVTIPLSSFRAEDSKLGKGKGASVASLTDLLGSTGNTGLNIYLHNFSTSPTATGFYAAFDNIRVVKIK